jgi:hypothetical protein
MASRKRQIAKLQAETENFSWPKIVQGSHLTVKTFEDGKTELIWDWDTVVNEVREACATVTPITKSK